WLSECSGAVTLRYRADALGRALTGESMTLEDTTAASRSGVVLTIDERIQKIAAQAAENHFSAGAVVVLEVGSAKIRAMVSLPGYDPENLAAALNDPSSPLVNRAVSAYNTGSVFKLAVACAAADRNEAGMTMECAGTTDYAGRRFQCIGGIPHGTVDISRAVAVSCNCYFIRLADTVGYQPILKMAQKLGFGRATWLAGDFCSAAGSLPSARDLTAPAALANFSFGQGELTATPLQIAAMVQAIACGGVYTEPSLVEGRLSDGVLTASAAAVSSRAMTAHTAELVRSYMMEAVENGTVSGGKPESGGAGAKTATAETGSTGADGEPVIQAWCAGFYPAEQPQYVITVLAENGKSGSKVCAPVFKEIADGLAALDETGAS
ncbi:MAG: penicillin-binding transpeptidase domain-containing protein, partial [Firmicutes bacterium]|nr:penicillin-binding transpeptidase domain-containing protein [Bacillota bacterium]